MSARFETFADTYLQVTLRGGQEWMCVCPLHDDRGASLQFNVVKGLWVCFGCQQGGTAKSLARRMNVSYDDPAVQTGELRKRLNAAVKRKHEKQAPDPLPESYLRQFGIERHEYWGKRGFTDETIDFWNLGYDFMEDQLTIPYRDPGGHLLGVIRRRLDNGFPRYLYPKGFDRAGSLFGSWTSERAVCLVEGSLDAIKTWQSGWPALAVYGSSINQRQVELLRRLGVKEVTLFFDYDEAGLKAFRDVPNFLEGFIVSKVIWPHDRYCPLKECTCDREHRPDPGSITEEDLWSFDVELVGRSPNRRKAI